eukprot:g30075.t1
MTWQARSILQKPSVVTSVNTLFLLADATFLALFDTLFLFSTNILKFMKKARGKSERLRSQAEKLAISEATSAQSVDATLSVDSVPVETSNPLSERKNRIDDKDLDARANNLLETLEARFENLDSLPDHDHDPDRSRHPTTDTATTTCTRSARTTTAA